MIILVFLGLLAYSVYLITTIKQGIMPEDAVPKDSFLTAYLGEARVHFKEKIAELDVVFYNTTFYRSTRRVSSSLGGHPQSLVSEMITELKNVSYILPQYENPWELFNSYLEENNVNPDNASGASFLYYLLMCVRAKPRIVENLALNMTTMALPASKVKFAIDPVAVNEMELGEKTLKEMRKVAAGAAREA